MRAVTVTIELYSLLLVYVGPVGAEETSEQAASRACFLCSCRCSLDAHEEVAHELHCDYIHSSISLHGTSACIGNDGPSRDACMFSL